MAAIKKIVLYLLLVFLGVSLWNSWQGRNQQAPQTNVLLESREVVADVHQRYVSVDTPLYVAHFDRVGGKLVQVALKGYKKALKGPVLETMLSGDASHPLHALAGSKGDERLVFTSSHQDLVVTDSKATLSLVAQDKNGLSHEKVFSFDPKKYTIGSKLILRNAGQQKYQGFVYMGYAGERKTALTKKQDPPKPADFLAGSAEAKQTGFFSGLTTFAGAAYHTGKKAYTKVTYENMAESPININAKETWAAVQKRYFLSAIIPSTPYGMHLSTSWQEGFLKGAENTYLQQFELMYRSPLFELNPGERTESSALIYSGPEVIENLEGLAPGLELTVDYGFLWMVSSVLFWLMFKINTFVQNWGVSIILLTALIKIVFYKLSESSYRSMARMKSFKPQIDAISEQHKDDPQAKNQAMVALYKKEKINPVGSCMPMLIQIPFFIAFYNVLVESIQLRHVPFLWLPDLASMDPFYILPLLMGLSMLFQQKLSPQPDDPIQAKMMYFTPVLFTAMFIAVPSGLVLYWLANNLFSIAQQWLVMKRTA